MDAAVLTAGMVHGTLGTVSSLPPAPGRNSPFFVGVSSGACCVSGIGRKTVTAVSLRGICRFLLRHFSVTEEKEGESKEEN